jgi:hypothetical protein
VIFKWPDRPTIEEIKGDFEWFANLVVWKLPEGASGKIW